MLNKLFHKEKPKDGPIEQANALYRKGKLVEALDMYSMEVLRQSNPSYLKVAQNWLTDPMLETAGESAICTFMVRIIPTIDRCETTQRTKLQTLCLDIVRRLTDCAPRLDTTNRYIAECILLRHMHKPEEALQAALTGIQKHGIPLCYTFAGLCYIDMEQAQEAEEYIKQGFQRDPSNGSGCNDMADFFFQRRQFLKAAEFYCLALQSGDKYDRTWAEPSLIYCNYILYGDPLDTERLAACAAVDLKNQRALRLCELARQVQVLPYVDYIPESVEASINFLRSMREQQKKLTQAKMALSCLEAPSCINAIRLEWSNYGKQEAQFDIIVHQVPDPPLDERLIPEGIALWQYQPNLDATAAVGHPTSTVSKRVLSLASQEYHLATWYENACTLAQGLTLEDVEGLYGIMVYPPPPTSTIGGDVWLAHVQYAAVCILAHLGNQFITVQSPEMKKYVRLLPSPELVRICFGQLDWPVIPALTLLAWQAKMGYAEPAIVLEVLNKLLNRVPKNDFCFFEHALVCAYSWFPGLDKEFHQKMRQRRLQLEEG